MYSYIRGKLVERDMESVVIEAGGVGYYIGMGPSLSSKLGELNTETLCYVYFHITQDNQQLFGFPTREYKQLFEKLLTVSGVGPKAGIALLEVYEPSDLALSIVREDSAGIVKNMRGKGVGKKTAERIIFELKDKFKDLSLSLSPVDEEIEEVFVLSKTADDNNLKNDVLEGLLFLGYQANEAKSLINKSFDSSLDLEDNLKNALKLAN